jgi:hypothetical protein
VGFIVTEATVQNSSPAVRKFANRINGAKE